jgi:hypothetical protein
MDRMKLLPSLLVGLLVFLPQVRAEDWEVVWKDSTQTLRVDRDSVRVDGGMVEYWYSDEVDALVDFMEHRYQVVSDCRGNRMRYIQVYDPASGESKLVVDPEWKDVAYAPDDPVAVMHYEVCGDYAGR